MLNRFIFSSYFPSSSLPCSQSCRAESLPLDDNPWKRLLKPQPSHTETSFWGRFLLWRGSSNMPLKLSALWVRKRVLWRSLVKLSHLYVQPSRACLKGYWGRWEAVRGQGPAARSQGPSLGNTSAIDSARHRYTSGENDMKLIAGSSMYSLNSPLYPSPFSNSAFWFPTLPVPYKFTKLAENNITHAGSFTLFIYICIGTLTFLL